MPHQLPLLAEERATYTTQRDDAERAAAIERLRAKLADPAFRAIEGFPIGEDEAILALSDPPFYATCPNPFLPEIVARWQEERRDIRADLGLPDDAARGRRSADGLRQCVDADGGALIARWRDLISASAANGRPEPPESDG